MSVFLDRVWYYQEMAEKTAMEETAGAIQSALTMQVGKNYMRNNQQELSKLATQNPVKWLQKAPKNYAGEFYDLPPRSLIAGNWVFDLKAHQLVYVIDRVEHFVPGKEGKNWIRFRVNVQQEAMLQNDVATEEIELVGTVFEPTEKTKWFQ
jgi:general secretion pathway protein G